MSPSLKVGLLRSTRSNIAASVGFSVESCCATGIWPELACAAAFDGGLGSRHLVRRLEGVGDRCLPAFWRSHRSFTAPFTHAVLRPQAPRILLASWGPCQAKQRLQDQVARKRRTTWEVWKRSCAHTPGGFVGLSLGGPEGIGEGVVEVGMVDFGLAIAPAFFPAAFPR